MQIVLKTACDLKLRIGHINNFVRMSGAKGINMGWNGTAVMLLKDRRPMVKKKQDPVSTIKKDWFGQLFVILVWSFLEKSITYGCDYYGEVNNHFRVY